MTRSAGAMAAVAAALLLPSCDSAAVEPVQSLVGAGAPLTAETCFTRQLRKGVMAL